MIFPLGAVNTPTPPQVVNWPLDTDVICQPGKRSERRTSAIRAHSVVRTVSLLLRTKQGRQRLALQAWLRRLVDAMHGRILVSTFQ